MDPTLLFLLVALWNDLPALPGLSPEDSEIVRNLELLEDLEFTEDLELFVGPPGADDKEDETDDSDAPLPQAPVPGAPK